MDEADLDQGYEYEYGYEQYNPEYLQYGEENEGDPSGP